MHCSSCGARAAEGARFCAGCGAALTGVALARGFTPAMVGAQRAMLVCPQCGQRATPMPYFARGANMAKAAALFIPFTFIGPIAFFFLRKDTFICSECRSVLPMEATLRLRDAFSPHAALPALAPGDTAEAALVRAEVTYLERHGRKNQGRAWLMGVVTAGFLAGAGAAVSGGEEEMAAALAGMGSLSGVAAGAAGHRGKKQRDLAGEKRAREATLRLLDLAREHGGRLTVTLVAAKLALDFKEAERLLDAMVDGRRVDMQVDDDGRINYVFTELALAPVRE